MNKACVILWFYALVSWAWDIHVDNIPLGFLLQTMADLNHQNIVLSERVVGKISLHLHHIGWQQFSRFLMETQSLAIRQQENILWVDKAYSFLPTDKQHPIAPSMGFVSIQLKHIEVEELKKLFEHPQQSLLSPLGKVMFEPHKNRFWVMDLPEYVQRIKTVVSDLDLREQQIIIDARIVSINSNYAKDLGVRLGFMQGGIISGELAGLHQEQELKPVINLPALPLQASPINFALSLAKLGQQYIDAELSWLEGQGGAKVMARPHLVTENLVESAIASGEDIPYQESSLNGATSVAFKKALLLLKVKPCILGNGEILLNIQINQDADSGQRVQGVPVISTKTMSTRVRVRSGETLVLGGIHKTDTHDERVGWPILKNIPGINLLFSRQLQRHTEEELLLFITPVLK